MGKLEWLGYNLVKVHDDRPSRLGTIHQHDRHTATFRDKQPHRQSQFCPAYWRQVAIKIHASLVLIMQKYVSLATVKLITSTRRIMAYKVQSNLPFSR